MLLATLIGNILYIFGKTAKYSLNPNLGSEPKLFQIRNRNRSKSLHFHNSGKIYYVYS